MHLALPDDFSLVDGNPVELIWNLFSVFVGNNFGISWIAEQQIVDLVCHVDVMIWVVKFLISFLTVVGRNMEISWNFVDFNLTLDLTPLFILQALNSWLIDEVLADVLVIVHGELLFTVFIQHVLVQSTFDVDNVNASHVYDIKRKDAAGSFGESYVYVKVELNTITSADLTNWSSSIVSIRISLVF
jgi:hypothetical protein